MASALLCSLGSQDIFTRYWVQFHSFLGLSWDPEQFQQDFWSISPIWSAEILAPQCYYNNYLVWLHLQDFTWGCFRVGCQSKAACEHLQSHFSSVVSTQEWWRMPSQWQYFSPFKLMVSTHASTQANRRHMDLQSSTPPENSSKLRQSREVTSCILTDVILAISTR